MATATLEKAVQGDGKGVVCDVDVGSLVPNRGMIIVRKEPQPTMTKGGVHLPDSAIHEQCIAKVLAVHEGCVLAVGQRVVFRRGAGVPLKFIGEDDVLVLQFANSHEDDVLAWVVDHRLRDLFASKL